MLGHIVWCMERRGCTDYALRRGDLYSGTLRDGNHKPTVPSAGASGLNWSTHHDVVGSVEFMGGWARRNSVWVYGLVLSLILHKCQGLTREYEHPMSESAQTRVDCRRNLKRIQNHNGNRRRRNFYE